MKTAMQILGWGCLLLLAGCGNGELATYPVAGQFKFEDGSVPMYGAVEFYSAEHQINARGNLERDGSFTLTTYQEGDGAVLGTHQVVLIQQTGSHFLARKDVNFRHDHGDLVDPRYNDYRTSGLECQIQSGTNQVTLTVKKMARQTSDGEPKR